MATLLILDVEELRDKWGWLLGLGIAMIVLGTISLAVVPAATIATVMLLGWLVGLSGIVEAIHAFHFRSWGGVFLHLMGGVLGVLVGLLVITHPVAGALAWTLLFASFLTIIGLFRLLAATRLKFSHWKWAALDGGVTLMLGILVWAGWPWSGIWFLGLSVGIALIMRGWSQVMLALALRSSLPARETNLPRAA